METESQLTDSGETEQTDVKVMETRTRDTEDGKLNEVLSGSEWFRRYGEWSEWLVNKNRSGIRDIPSFAMLKDFWIQEDVLSVVEANTIEREPLEYRRLSRLADIISQKPSGIIERFFEVIRVNDPIMYYQFLWPEPPARVPPRNDKLPIVQHSLQSWYKQSLSRIQPIPFSPFVKMNLEQIFTNLRIIKHDRSPGAKTSEMKDPITKDKSLNSPKFFASSGENVSSTFGDLWKSGNRTVTFVQGPAGIGKSTLCRMLAYRWANDDFKLQGKHFDLVFILEASVIVENLKQTFSRHVFPEDFTLDMDTVFQCIQDSWAKCLLVIDGVDDLTASGKSTVQKLLEGRFLRDANVLLTGRPEVAKDFVKFVDHHLEIKGFSPKSTKHFVCKYFSCKSSRDFRPLKRLLNSFNKDRQIRQLAKCPFLALMLCLLMEDNCNELPLSQYEIVKQVIETICRLYICKQKQIAADTGLNENDIIIAAGHLAHLGLKGETLAFLEEKVKSESELGDHLLRCGLLNRDFTLSRLHDKGYCYFPHKFIQEFLCAFYLGNCPPSTLKTMLRAIPYHFFFERFDLMYTFLAKTRPRKSCIEVILAVAFTPFPGRQIGMYNRLIYVIDRLCENNDNGMILNAVVDCLACPRNYEHNRLLCRYGAFDTDKGCKLTMDHVRLAGRRGAIRNLLTRVVIKMDLPPVFHVTDMLIRAWNIWKVCVGDTGVFAALSCFRRQIVCSNEKFVFVKSVKLTWVHCDGIQLALDVLPFYLSNGLRVLTVSLVPDMFTLQDVNYLISKLSDVSRNITVVLVVVKHPLDDQMDVKLVELVSRASLHSVTLRYCFISLVLVQDRHLHSEWIMEGVLLDLFNNEGIITHKYVFPWTMHQLYYDRFCPY